MNIGAEFSTHIEDFLTICQYQMNKFDCLSIDDIDQVKTNVMASWQEIIRHGDQSGIIVTDMEDTQFKSN